MEKRIRAIIILFFLVLIVTIIGNYIHLSLIKKEINYENRDVYFKWDKDNLAILIEVDRSRLHIINLSLNEIVKTYTVATGKPSTPTPLGTFRIIDKARWGGGFGSRWLGLDVPWGRYGIHGTNRPGSIGLNVSAGCIRMRNKDVEELYEYVGHNTLVTIINGNYGPFAHSFRNLRPGDRGADVMEVQKRLQIKGYYTSTIDGIYGEGMKRALIQYLKENNLPLTDTIGYAIYKELDILLMD